MNHTQNTTGALETQAQNLKRLFITALASARVQSEAIKRSRTARLVCCLIIGSLSLTLWTLVTYRTAQHHAERRFAEWQQRFVDDYITQQEAAERQYPPDLHAMLQEQENEELAKLISGLRLYQYGREDYITLGQCVINRTLNSAYPATIVEVIQQPGQWPGYSEENEVTAQTYELAAGILNALRAQTLQPCDSSLTIAEFGQRITLRNTLDYSRDTVTWRAGQ